MLLASDRDAEDGAAAPGDRGRTSHRAAGARSPSATSDCPTPLNPRPPRSSLRIGDVARLVGTTPRTIRYYEEIGLLPGGARATVRPAPHLQPRPRSSGCAR